MNVQHVHTGTEADRSAAHSWMHNLLIPYSASFLKTMGQDVIWLTGLYLVDNTWQEYYTVCFNEPGSQGPRARFMYSIWVLKNKISNLKVLYWHDKVQYVLHCQSKHITTAITTVYQKQSKWSSWIEKYISDMEIRWNVSTVPYPYVHTHGKNDHDLAVCRWVSLLELSALPIPPGG